MSLADAVQKLLDEGLKPGDEVPLGFFDISPIEPEEDSAGNPFPKPLRKSKVTLYSSAELKSMDQELTEALEESTPEEVYSSTLRLPVVEPSVASEAQCPDCGELESEHSKRQADECHEKWLLTNRLINDVIDQKVASVDPAVIVCSSLEEMVASVKEHIASTGEAVYPNDLPTQKCIGYQAEGGTHWALPLATLKETTGPLRAAFQTGMARAKFCEALNAVPEKHDFGGVLGLVLGTSALLALSLKPTTNPRVHEEASPEVEAESTSEVESEAVRTKS